jgi:2-polyprenyl-6-methoxyphenol hydroxylase-like FAD-dependent oxidoreductase
MRVAVAGGGIAGLTASIALAARGISVALFERAAEFEEIGAGIQLSPNAMAVLERLGVTRDLEGKLFEPEALVVRSGRTGAVIARVPLGSVARERYGAPYCTLHRADLQSALVATARRNPTIGFHLHAPVADVRPAEKSVVFTAGGLGRKADVLIAADGIHSHVRTGYFGHPGPMPLGRNAWRATVPKEQVASIVPFDMTGLWLGPKAHVVHYPVKSGDILNVVAITEGGGDSPPLERFGRAARRLLEAVTEWTPWPLLALDATLPWTRGRVALVGDAAHAMPPSAAQGGAQAIEDAWVLAKMLADAIKTPEEALASFEQARRARVARVAQESSRNLNTYEMAGAPAVFRNIILRGLPASLLTSRLDWLFGWRPE